MPRAVGPRCIRCNKPLVNRVQCLCSTIVCSELCAKAHIKNCRQCREVIEKEEQAEGEAFLRSLDDEPTPDPRSYLVDHTQHLLGELDDYQHPKAKRSSGLFFYLLFAATPIVLVLVLCIGVPIWLGSRLPASVSTRQVVESASSPKATETGPRPTEREPIPKPLEPLTAGGLTEQQNGKIVQVRGKVTESLGRTGVVLDGSLSVTFTNEPRNLRTGETITVEGTAFLVSGRIKLGKARLID